jgi:hypothetical protein
MAKADKQRDIRRLGARNKGDVDRKCHDQHANDQHQMGKGREPGSAFNHSNPACSEARMPQGRPRAWGPPRGVVTCVPVERGGQSFQ